MTVLRNNAGYILSGLVMVLSIVGARMQNNAVLFALIGIVIMALLLVVFNRISEKQYPVLLFFIGLGLIYQVSLQTNYLVGTDIHYEYYFAQLTYNNGFWDSSIGHSYNAATSISVFIPAVAKTLHIPLEWAFKVVPPLFLAGVPVVTYHIFRREFDTKTAFLATFFFISVPTMFLELSGLAKQAIGELFLISCLALIVFDFVKRKWLRYSLIGILAILTALSHYSMGGTLFFYLIGAVVLLPIGRYLFKLDTVVNIKYVMVAVVVFIVAGTGFYSWAADGAPLRDIMGSVGITSKTATAIVSSPTTTTTTGLEGMSDSGAGSSGYAHWTYPEPAVAVALGGDFMEVDGLSKVFRIFQYATQVLIIVGGMWVLWNYKKRSLGYMVFLAISCIVLLLVIFYPGFSPIFNASRFYNLILLFASPLAIIGGKLIFRDYRILACVVLIPYLLFTSGVIFEAVKSDNLYRITIPYSNALSAARTDSTALFTNGDIEARNWIKASNSFPVYGDMWGATAVFEVQSNLDPTKVNMMLQKSMVETFVFREGSTAPDPVPDDCYILLRERNTEKQEITYQVGVGLRKTVSYSEVGFDEVLEGRDIVFQSGNAVVYGMKE